MAIQVNVEVISESLIEGEARTSIKPATLDNTQAGSLMEKGRVLLQRSQRGLNADAGITIAFSPFTCFTM